MANPQAKITLVNNTSIRGLFQNAVALRIEIQHDTGDMAQIHELKRFYKYDADAGAVGDDDGLNIIRPNNVLDLAGNGRWLSNNIFELDGLNPWHPDHAGIFQIALDRCGESFEHFGGDCFFFHI